MNDDRDRDSEFWKMNPFYCRDSIGCLFFALIIFLLFGSFIFGK